jgi:hypothetical protein
MSGIDKSQEFWRSNDSADLPEYLIAVTEEGYPATRFRHSVCSCQCESFKVEFNEDEDVALRTCSACAQKEYMLESEQFWPEVDEADIELLTCGACKGDMFNICSGFSMRDGDEDVKWVTVGCRCIVCGQFDVFLDLKVSQSPSLHLMDAV